MLVPQTPYSYVKNYEIIINDRVYAFQTLISADNIVMWMPDSEQQHVNPQYRDDNFSVPVRLNDLNIEDIIRMIQQIKLFKTKVKIPLEHILTG